MQSAATLKAPPAHCRHQLVLCSLHSQSCRRRAALHGAAPLLQGACQLVLLGVGLKHSLLRFVGRLVGDGESLEVKSTKTERQRLGPEVWTGLTLL